MPPLKVKKQIRLLVVLPYNVNYGFHIIIISSYWPGISQIYICLILGSKNNDWTLVVIPLMHDVLACLLTMLFVALTISNDNGPSNTSNVCSNTSDDHIRHYFGTYWCSEKKHFFGNRTNKFLGDQFLPKMEQQLKEWNSKSLDQLTFQCR